MHKSMGMRRRVLQVVVCAVVSWCVAPRATIAAAQCLTIEGPKLVPVPDLEGETVEAASKTLQAVGLNLGSVNPSGGKGVVFQQSPDPNRCIPIGKSVDIAVKNVTPAPATTVEVPDLRGQSLLGAALDLWKRGLRPGGSSKQQSNEVPPGRILNQQPEAGTRVPKGTAVVVTLAQAVMAPSPPSKTATLQETLSLKSNLIGPAIPGELVTFTAFAEGPAHAIQFRFDFGDGQRSSASDSPQARHAYGKDGNYTTTVTAILDGGAGQLTASTDVGVHDGPQGVTLVVGLGPVKEKQAVTFTARPFPPEPAPLRYTFKFGDKSEEVSETPSVTHVYPESNVYYPFVTIVTAHGHTASSKPVRLIVVAPPPPPVWVIVLVVSATFVGVVGYKLLQQWVTRGISSKLRLVEVTVRLQASHVGLEEDEFQFHATHSAGAITVPAQASVVGSVEVRK